MVGPQPTDPTDINGSLFDQAAIDPTDQATTTDQDANEAADPSYGGQLPTPPVPTKTLPVPTPPAPTPSPAPPTPTPSPAPATPPSFATLNQAAEAWGKQYNGQSILKNKEYGSWLYKNADGTFTWGALAEGGVDGLNLGDVLPGQTPVGDIHSHGAYVNDPTYVNHTFSPTDIEKIEGGEFLSPGYLGYVATPDGNLQQYNPVTNLPTVVGTDLPSDPADPVRKNTVDPKY